MIYLDNAATTYPKPEATYERIDHVLRNIGGSPGRASHRMAIEADRVIFSARESLAKLFGIGDSSRLVFTKNATEALNTALKGILEPGDHLITSAFEHNSVARPVKRLETEGVNVTWLRGATPGLLTPSEVRAAFTPETKLVCITHASNVFGEILPAADIGAVCREEAVLFMLDASQTAGAIPLSLNTLNVDILAGTGHKALMGPQGTGFLYLAPGVEPAPLLDGGTGEIEDLLDLPERLEAGTMNMPGVAGLGAGVDFLLNTGVKTVRAHETELCAMLIEGICKIDGSRIVGPAEAALRASLVSFNIDGKDPRDVGIALDEEYSIMVRSGMHCAPEAHKEADTFPLGAIRVSPGYFNTKDEIEKFLGAVRKIISR